MVGETKRDVVGSILTRIREAVIGVTVYHDPIERGGVTVIPASLVIAGGGGGGGEDAKSGGSGEGGGFGMITRPVGAYVVRGDAVTWKPAVSPGVIVLIVLIGVRLIRRVIRSLD